ncbi:hypothetical protein [Moraxella cuniculi]|nr:hypothetical protein [Moraxella cuniculi]OOS03273.1 hypothetical protein B0189_09735 [Moraxella cuniculi]
MIALDLPIATEQALIAQAKQHGLSIEDYLLQQLDRLTQRQFGGAESALIAISDDFDAPLDEFEGYQ